ncbi:Hypothetical predicted protein [Scomber scombrus]|uniref:Uncharacterized protein n=1 Tax=Scomber scombrus TaxID=13677 RepID=A0AAV1PVU2_SCOSC
MKRSGVKDHIQLSSVIDYQPDNSLSIISLCGSLESNVLLGPKSPGEAAVPSSCTERQVPSLLGIGDWIKPARGDRLSSSPALAPSSPDPPCLTD